MSFTRQDESILFSELKKACIPFCKGMQVQPAP